MRPRDVVFPLEPVYRKAGIAFLQAKAVAIHPEGSEASPGAFIDIEYTTAEKQGQREQLHYDYLINATGPKLNFAATPGLGPDQHSLSVCTPSHAEQASLALSEIIAALKRGEQKTIVIGMGNGACTCQGAAFEYVFNVDHELRLQGVRDRAEIIYLTNEYEVGDFGVGGMTFSQNGFLTSSQLWTESLYRERGVRAIVRSHVQRVEDGEIFFETLDGTEHSIPFDFAMLIPPFRGVGLTAFNKAGEEITDTLFAPNGFLKVDADYTQKPYSEWRAADWPSTYQSPHYPNLFAIGIAFAPPHPISIPRLSPNGTPIGPTPPRTGMPSGVMGRQVALSITDMIDNGAKAPTHKASMASMGAACVASAGAGLFTGTAAAMTMYPVVPDYERFPGTGRDIKETYGEIGLAAHWIKHTLHFVFIYKAKALPGWSLLPE
jgi:sulfide:quinone oxidoreductase